MRKEGIGAVLIAVLICIIFVSAEKFSDSNQSDFNNGNYFNTSYNGTGVVLSGNNVSGAFVSRVFDAGGLAVWRNASWVKSTPSGFSAFLTSAIYTGINISSVFVKDDNYAVMDMKDTTKRFYLNFSQNLTNGTILKLFAKIDKDTSTIGIYAWNDSLGSSPLGNFTVNATGRWQNVSLLISYPLNAIWLGEGNGSTIDPKGEFDYIYAEKTFNSNISFFVRNCSLANCSGSFFTDYSGINLTSRYFQYRADFIREKWDESALLERFDINYTVLDNIAPNLEINSPVNINYSNSTIFVNISANDESEISTIWFFDGVENVSYSSPFYYEFNEGATRLIAYANDSFGNVNSSSITFFVDSLAPFIEIYSPESKTYSYNTSILLNFSVSDSGIGIGSCWYKISGGLEKNANCSENAFFNVSGDGGYNLTLYANDSIGNLAFEDIIFSISTTLAVSLKSPLNLKKLNTKEVNLSYDVMTADKIDRCDLWLNSSSGWQMNQSNSSVVNTTGGINNFNLELEDGDYLWNVFCAGKFSSFALNNRSFTIDSSAPVLSISEPSGTKGVLSNIPLIYSVSDSSLVNCSYNVSDSNGNIEIMNANIPNCAPTNFNVRFQTSYVLWFMAKDELGNSVVKNSSFSVSVPTVPPVNGGGGGYFPIIGKVNDSIKKIFNLELNDIENQNMKHGTNKTIYLTVTNTGNSFANNCNIFVEGEMKDWIFSKENKGLSPGEKTDFELLLEVPQDAIIDNYGSEIIVNCDEGSKNVSINLNIFMDSFEAKIDDYYLSGRQMNVNYSMKEYANEDHLILVNYSLIDQDGLIALNGQDEVVLKANRENQYQLSSDLPKNAFGQFNLKIIFSNKNTVIEKEREVFIPSRGLTGFAINGENRRILSIIGVVLISLITLFFVARFIYEHNERTKKQSHVPRKRGFIKLDLE